VIRLCASPRKHLALTLKDAMQPRPNLNKGIYYILQEASGSLRDQDPNGLVANLSTKELVELVASLLRVVNDSSAQEAEVAIYHLFAEELRQRQEEGRE
jgi:hypothetical protein